MTQQSDERMAELRALFFESAQELLQVMNDEALKLEKNPGDTELVRSLRRIVHTLKGDAAACGYRDHASADVCDHRRSIAAGREHVGKGGIVRDPVAHQLAISKVAASLSSLHWDVIGTTPSPITGAEGNQEFLLYAKSNHMGSGLQLAV